MMRDEPTRSDIDAKLTPQFVWTWLLRVMLFVVPVLPFLLIFYFLLPGLFGVVYVVLLAVLFVLEFPLTIIGEPRSRAIFIVHTLQALFCWISVFYFLILWARLIPGLRLFVVGWIAVLLAATFWPRQKSLVHRPDRIYVSAGLLILVGILLHLNVSPLLLLLFLAGLMVLRRIVRRLDETRRLSMPAWTPLVFVATYAMIMVIGLHVYRDDQSDMAEKIASQDGVFRIDPDWYDPQRLRDRAKLADDVDVREYIFPSHDYVAFLPYGDNLLLLPQHELQVLRLHRQDGIFVLPTENVVADNLVVDAVAGCYYFVAGNALYRGFVDNDVMEELHVFTEANFTNTTPSFLRGWPDNDVRRLLVQYGNDTGFMVYDLPQRKARRIELGTIVHDSIFHPDGDKFIAVANGSNMFGKRFVLLDQVGNELREEPLHESGFVFLAPAEGEYFFTSLFVKGIMQKRSVDSLKLAGSFPVAPGTRGMKVLSGGRCLLTPNFLAGGVELLDAASGALLTGWWLGYRVRSITPSLDGSAYFLPSAAGLFGLDAATVSLYCAAADR
ncbi:MAG TPA: hypothetical protein PKW95_05905 [bacterium]|nr:hypothetical protein [bacterium]